MEGNLVENSQEQEKSGGGALLELFESDNSEEIIDGRTSTTLSLPQSNNEDEIDSHLAHSFGKLFEEFSSDQPTPSDTNDDPDLHNSNGNNNKKKNRANDDDEEEEEESSSIDNSPHSSILPCVATGAQSYDKIVEFWNEQGTVEEDDNSSTPDAPSISQLQSPPSEPPNYKNVPKVVNIPISLNTQQLEKMVNLDNEAEGQVNSSLFDTLLEQNQTNKVRVRVATSSSQINSLESNYSIDIPISVVE